LQQRLLSVQHTPMPTLITKTVNNSMRALAAIIRRQKVVAK
jgi:hypothetical protein